MTPIYKKHIAQRIQEMIDGYIAEGRLPATIYVPRTSYTYLSPSVRVALPPVRRKTNASFLTHEIRLVPSAGDDLEVTLMAKVSDGIAKLHTVAVREGHELEAIELTDYEAAVLMLEQRQRVSYHNAMSNPHDTEWTGSFMGVPLRLGKSLENNDF